MLSDFLHLLVEDCAGRVARENEERADWTVAGVQVFVETTGCTAHIG